MLIESERAAGGRTWKRRRWLLYAPLAWLVCLLVFLLWPEGAVPPAPRYVSVAQLGPGTGAEWSVPPQFAISNVSQVPVTCRFIGTQILVTNRSRTATNVNWTWLPGWRSVVLQTGKSISVMTEPPTNGAPWRFAVFVECPKGYRQRTAEILEPHLPRGLYWLLTEYSHRAQFSFSPIFIPEELGERRSGATNVTIP